MSERTREAAKKVRRDYDVAAMIRIVEAYRDKLDYSHPPIRSDKFRERSAYKWACDEILGQLKSSGDLPFDVTALDILEQFASKMKRYHAEHEDKDHADCFTNAGFLAEYFIEQYWFNGLGEN